MDEEKFGSETNPGSGPGAGAPSGEPDALGSNAGNGAEEIAGDSSLRGRPEAGRSNPEIVSPSARNDNTKNLLHVRLAVYDGPLDLLLDLIKKNEMDITDIQISEITRQYLERLNEMRSLDLDVAGEFIVMAATLIYIKSKMLLPDESQTDDDEDGLDPRAELIRKLLEYQAFREAARELGLLEDERGKTFTRQIADYYLGGLDPEDTSIDTFSANLFDLMSAFQAVMARLTGDPIHEVFEQRVTIEEKIGEIRILLQDKGKILFSSLFERGSSRNLLIVTFLALLEIVRTRLARVRQDRQFGDIVIETC